MNSSGIKRGLAVSAVSALAVTGLAGTAHAVESGDAYSITLTPSVSSVSTGENVTYTVVAKTAAGGNATGDVNITFAEPTTETTEALDPIDSSVTGFAETGTATDKSYTYAGTVTLTDGKATFTVDSTLTGSVAVHASAHGAGANSSFTVGGGATTGLDAVKSITAVPSATAIYDADDVTIKVRPLDASGYGVPGANLSYTVDNGATQPVGATSTGSYDKTISGLPTTVGTHTVKIWANQTTGAQTTPGLDSGEPTQSITYTVVATPDTYADAFTSSAVTEVAGTPELPAGEGIAVPVTVKVLNDSDDKPAAGVSVRVDAYYHGKTKSAFGTTDSSGLASVSFAVDAADATGDFDVEAYASKAPEATSGDYIGSDTIATFTARATSVKPQVTDPLQAVKGGTVNVPVVVADQFGKVASGHILNVTIAGGNAAKTSGGPIQITTNSAGQATLTYTDAATTYTAVGTADDTITFVDSTSNSVGDGTATVDYLATVTPATITPTSQPGASTTSTVDEDDSYYYEVKVTNATGDALSNSPVTFTVTNGFVSKTGDKIKPGAGLSTVTVTTDGDGYAEVYVGSEKVGDQILTVTDGAAAPVSFKKQTYVADSFYGLTVSSIGTIANGGTGKVTATATDRFGNPVAFQNVLATQTGVGSFAGGVSSVQGLTAADGTVSFTVAGGTTAGSGKVTIVSNTVTKDDYATVSAFETGTVDVAYTVAAPVKTAPSTPSTPSTPKPAAAKVSGLSGHSKGKKDVITVTGTNGAAVSLYKKGKKVGSKVLAGGKAVFRIKDKNGKKKTTYKAVVGSTSVTKKIK
ncbi:beta strand repeat-containing protein [Nocardioides sp. Kera G14]|uniref:beta strand repeat-containing protein n=1 Tax=Nocardioides sp. Kera G14 TaxID=2884264 RepID=UPI001D126CF4|nr:hypothetical protein [Nocardioides sp. Kera G14]UDY23729.1 hypothetical protein LH076_00065 [Nocardioides sp. Kera G14]